MAYAAVGVALNAVPRHRYLRERPVWPYHTFAHLLSHGLQSGGKVFNARAQYVQYPEPPDFAPKIHVTLSLVRASIVARINEDEEKWLTRARNMKRRTQHGRYMWPCHSCAHPSSLRLTKRKKSIKARTIWRAGLCTKYSRNFLTHARIRRRSD